MAEVIGEHNTKNFRPSFFTGITLVMAFFIFSGFTFTYLQPMATGVMPPTPPVVHLHGFVFFTWMVLLVSQSLLVNVRNMALHRSLGTFGIGLGTAVIILGSLITLLSLTPYETYDRDAAGLTYLSFLAVITFTCLFIMAIRNIRQPEKHKRLILFATIVMLPPGINRLYMMTMDMFSPPFLATWLTMDALVAAILINDWRTLGKVMPVSVFGAAVIILPQVSSSIIIDSSAFAAFNDFFEGLVYYR